MIIRTNITKMTIDNGTWKFVHIHAYCNSMAMKNNSSNLYNYNPALQNIVNNHVENAWAYSVGLTSGPEMEKWYHIAVKWMNIIVAEKMN